jgi:hypothetical protein
VSFDPQNPRGAPRPSQPPTPPPTPPQSPRPPTSYIPPQPVNRGPSRLLIAGGAIIGVLVIGIAILFVLNLVAKPTTPAPPTTSHSASTAPTVAGSPNGSSVPLATPPTTGASLTPTPGGSIALPSPGTPEAILLSHIPDSLRPTCSEQTAASSPPIYIASCSANTGQINVNYSMYASVEIMNAAYQDTFTAEQIDPGTGSCEDHSTWPAEGPYLVEGAPVGRRLCTDRPGFPTIYWTDDRLFILSNASSPTGDAAGLLTFWTTQAGPIQ